MDSGDTASAAASGAGAVVAAAASGSGAVVADGCGWESTTTILGPSSLNCNFLGCLIIVTKSSMVLPLILNLLFPTLPGKKEYSSFSTRGGCFQFINLIPEIGVASASSINIG